MSTIIGVCSSARQDNVNELLLRLNRIPDVEAEFVKLPYNNLDGFQLRTRLLHGVIICHSIHNRRFAITDVTDALYNKFLPHVKHVIGKQNVAVIGHDFPWPLSMEDPQSDTSHRQKKNSHLAAFKIQQPTTFDCSSLAMVCGRLDANLEMDDEDWELLVSFITHVTPVKQTSFLQSFFTTVGLFAMNVKKVMCIILPYVVVPVALLSLVGWIWHKVQSDRARAIVLSKKADASPEPWYSVPFWKAPYSFCRHHKQTSIQQSQHLVAGSVSSFLTVVVLLTKFGMKVICITGILPYLVVPVALLSWVGWIWHKVRGDTARAKAVLSKRAEGSPGLWYVVPFWKAPYSFCHYYKNVMCKYLQRWWWGDGRDQHSNK